MTQNDMILNYLRRYKSISQREAMNELGIFRLASRIFDLKKAGVNINTAYETVMIRNGEKTQIARYFLDEE